LDNDLIQDYRGSSWTTTRYDFSPHRPKRAGSLPEVCLQMTHERARQDLALAAGQLIS